MRRVVGGAIGVVVLVIFVFAGINGIHPVLIAVGWAVLIAARGFNYWETRRFGESHRDLG
jgi:hypothetical protein